MFIKFPRAYDSGSVFYKAGEVRDLDKRTADLLVAQGAAVPHVTTSMDDYSNGSVSLLAQSAVPVMIAQSGQVQATGATIPGPITAAVTVGLSATSGAGVTVTLGSALLAGTSADVGKQISVFDAVNSVWRSILITANSSTTVCTGTLASTFSSTSIAATSAALGSPLPTNYVGGIWAYLPTGAVTGGAAGFYWCVATATATANGILQATAAFQAAMNVPAVPTGFANAVGSGSNFTGSTSAVTLTSVTVPGGVMGANGALRTAGRISVSATSDNKVVFQNFGGQPASISNTVTTTGLPWTSTGRNRGTPTSQIWPAFGSDSAAASAYQTVDTTADRSLVIGCQQAAATAFTILECSAVELMSRA